MNLKIHRRKKHNKETGMREERKQQCEPSCRWMCCLLVIMYSRGVVILSIVEKRLSAILHILLVIGTYYNVQHNTQNVLWNT